MSVPTIEFDGFTSYTVTLFRNGKKEYFVFSRHTLSICAAPENQLEPSERLLIEGPVADDGFLYYLHAKPYDSGLRSSIVWLKDKEEAEVIERVLLFLEENEDAAEDYYDDDCSFCGGEKDSENECYVDHEGEVREEASRKSFEVEVHSPEF